MKRDFLVLIFLFFIFSILNANPLKNEAELQKVRNKADKIVQEELKNDYKKEYPKRKNNLNKVVSNGENLFEDEDFVFQLEDGILTRASKKLKSIPNTSITKSFDKDRNLLNIVFFTIIDENFLLYRYYDKDLNLAIDIYCANGKCIKKGYYSNKQLAYILEGDLIEDLNILHNGKYIEYYKNGKIKVQGNYKEGKRVGEFKTFQKDGKSAGSVIYKDGKIIKSTLVNSMKNNASFSPITDINYIFDTSHAIKKVEFENDLLKLYFVFDKNGLPNGDSIEYYEEGNIKSVIPFKHNIVEGLTISYYENGNIKEKVNYKNNKINGEAKSYDENGKLNGKTIFKDDIKLEEEVHKEDEILKNTFKNGEVVKQDICSPNGTLKERRVLNGDEMEYSSFYQNGNVMKKILFKDKVVIKEQIYDENGDIMLNSFLLDGKPVTEIFEYYPNGKLRKIMPIINKEITQNIIKYYSNGNVKSREPYVNGKLNGEVIFYYENGQIKEKRFYINGKEEGVFELYTPQGRKFKELVFKKGKKIEEREIK
ncbi:phosphatidylinositol-4-phosphate 5-kinase [Fusobacterium simiae]|uniref:Phosphatidylinositol-4-phosphate 5-kinase n=1 Tax=Fusobacterium simiae TaxID=855 RepID=A0ABT4DHP6_FUSSI|nr:toxin-antitoxin system YwqK family antitoxin [Fusobacterium simiae]MCY7008128.1 phosphatidylinositol-4-phosphate 5-kinase [Fusobacterium simiae]